MIKYYPYKSDRPNKIQYIITEDYKKVNFGQASYSVFTIYKDEAKKLKYIKDTKMKNWTKSGINSSGFWSRWLLWHQPTTSSSYQDI